MHCQLDLLFGRGRARDDVDGKVQVLAREGVVEVDLDAAGLYRDHASGGVVHVQHHSGVRSHALFLELGNGNEADEFLAGLAVCLGGGNVHFFLLAFGGLEERLVEAFDDLLLADDHEKRRVLSSRLVEARFLGFFGNVGVEHLAFGRAHVPYRNEISFLGHFQKHL